VNLPAAGAKFIDKSHLSKEYMNASYNRKLAILQNCFVSVTS